MAEERRRRGKGRDARQEERDTLLEGLSRTRTLLAQAYGAFNTARDPYLIESYVFEINALQARYSYLLRRVKLLDGCAVHTPPGSYPYRETQAKEGCI
ncbi:YaaL family protein [Pseudoflavonifractor phocaeensis]|uniref:DUF2508 family protein n=1 Tax=Pseudoflavonifractor phocaeensis TaxID=1870988 RepID=UPI001957C78A|nr:DUF2508 family protein [Pseudoflavonifractor phocaeensis]MBM6870321.1 YaaL family protein [Pseudoflavonifractor phocaeensis]MBM6939302.1 YaaL family protein [Pseudoflavonifractor phocaeensis]